MTPNRIVRGTSPQRITSRLVQPIAEAVQHACHMLHAGPVSRPVRLSKRKPVNDRASPG